MLGFFLGVAATLAGGFIIAQTFSPPGAPPPGANADPPLNLGSVSQTKQGELGSQTAVASPVYYDSADPGRGFALKPSATSTLNALKLNALIGTGPLKNFGSTIILGDGYGQSWEKGDFFQTAATTGNALSLDAFQTNFSGGTWTGGNTDSYGRGIYLDSQNNVYQLVSSSRLVERCSAASLTKLVKYSAQDGSVAWTKDLPARAARTGGGTWVYSFCSVVVNSQDQPIVMGRRSVGGGSPYETVLLKLDPAAGRILDEVDLTGLDLPIHDPAIDGNDNIYGLTATATAGGLTVVSFNPALRLRWIYPLTQQIGSITYYEPSLNTDGYRHGLALDPAGNLYVGGSAVVNYPYEARPVITKFTASGTPVWGPIVYDTVPILKATGNYGLGFDPKNNRLIFTAKKFDRSVGVNGSFLYQFMFVDPGDGALLNAAAPANLAQYAAISSGVFFLKAGTNGNIVVTSGNGTSQVLRLDENLNFITFNSFDGRLGLTDVRLNPTNDIYYEWTETARPDIPHVVRIAVTTDPSFPVFYPSGWHRSQIFDLGGATNLQDLETNLILNSGTVSIEVDLSDDNFVTTGYSQTFDITANGTTTLDLTSLPAKRYLQLKTSLTTPDQTQSPLVNSLLINYNTRAANTIDLLGSSLINVSKLNVSTIDPVYQIDGRKYASYGAESIGQKLLVTGRGRLTNGRFVLNLTDQPVGSDLWLFGKIVQPASIVPQVQALQAGAVLRGDIKDGTLLIDRVTGPSDAAFTFTLYGDRKGLPGSYPNLLTKDQARQATEFIDLDALPANAADQSPTP